MDNINVGDVLADRDTRRQGREVKVVWVDTDHITVETIKDPINAKTSAIGNQTDIKRDRLKKGYTLLGPATSVEAGTVTSNVATQPQVNVFVNPGIGTEEVVGNRVAQELSRHIDDELGYEDEDSDEWYDDGEDYHGWNIDDDGVITVDGSINAQNIKGAEDELITDEVSLESALNTAGYFWLPPLEELEEAVDGLLHITSKKGIVALLHGTIRGGAIPRK